MTNDDNGVDDTEGAISAIESVAKEQEVLDAAQNQTNPVMFSEEEALLIRRALIKTLDEVKQMFDLLQAGIMIALEPLRNVIESMELMEDTLDYQEKESGN